MRRASSRRPSDEGDDGDEDPTEETPKAGHRESSGKPPHARRPKRHLKAWDDPARGPGSAPDEPGEGEDEEEEEAPAKKEPIYYRARDSIWFEPLVALMIIVLLLVSLFAYTSNWPPVYVVESESMQHGYDDQLGLINTGDLVLAQHIDVGSIVTYIVGMQTGHSTYGEPGDVLLYHRNGNTGEAPIIHRALFYVSFNANNGSYSVPELAGLPCGNAANAVYSVTDRVSGCGPMGLKGTLSLYGIGWHSVEVDLPMTESVLGRHSGFVTMGDNNFDGDNTSAGVNDQLGQLSSLVEGDWVIGVARGMIPWFGSLKLALDGHAQEVPPQSWQYMGLTLVVLFVSALGFHLFLRREGIEDERRKLREEEEAEEEEESEGSRGPRKPRRGLHLWTSEEEAPSDPEDDAEDEEPIRRSKSRKGGRPSSSDRGRPAPRVGRRAKTDDEDDETL